MDQDKYIGRLLDGRYEILEVIGTGGMAVVYKARCHRLNRLVAIKILKDDYVQDEEFRRRFHAEGEAVGMLSHPNIVSVYDVSSSFQADFIVMELIDGITLKQYMEKKGFLNWKETLHFAIQIAKALEHAHSRGLVHRDIKPHNVMVLKNGSVKVADFGIAQLMSQSNTLTKEALGSVHYISPEQAKGGRVDNRSDIYSLGIVMYEMVAGRVPYDGESPVGVAIQHINGGAAKPSTLNPNIPPRLEAIIMKAMALSPDQRYPTATAMLYEMDEFRKSPTAVPAVSPDPNDDRTRVIPTQQPQPRKPKTMAERTAVKKDPNAVNNPARKPRPKPPEEEEEEEESGNKVAAIAIISCAAVGLIALIIFLVLLAQGSLFAKETMVEVPNLLGHYYDALREYPGLTIERQNSENSDEYEKGQIIHQYPPAGEEVVSGTKVFITVSLGAEAPEKTMELLTDVKAEEAKRFLDGLDMGLNIIQYEENSADVDVGNVTRTEPAAGEPLVEGQTVRLWVSTGPEIIEAEVPNVVGKDYDTALAMLEANGFKNIRQNPVDSAEKKDQVVAQSIDKYETVDVTSLIVLDVSTGISNVPTETQPPTVAPTTPPETQPVVTEPPVTEPPTDPQETQPTLPEGMELLQDYPFILPYSMDPYKLSIKAGDEWFIENVSIEPGRNEIRYNLIGTGTVIYELYINGEFYREEVVVFSPDE